MKKVIIVALIGAAVGLAVAFVMLFMEFGGVEEQLIPWRPEGLK